MNHLSLFTGSGIDGENRMTDAPAIEEIARCPHCGYVGELDEFDSLGLDDGALICPECNHVGETDQETIGGPSAGEESHMLFS